MVALKLKDAKFIQYKSPISINDIDINKIVVPNKFTFGKQELKYFIGYKDSETIRSYVYSINKWLNIQ